VGQLRCSWDVATIGRCPRARADQLVVGDLAYEGGIESGDAILAGQHVSFEQRVTNVYRREAGGWKIVHYHSDPSPAMQDVRARLHPPPG
jgi:ketosteroid isomerase-like protein